MLSLIKKKDTSMPLDKFFKLVKPKYVYLKITPHKSIRNYNSSNIAKSIALSYKSINKLIRIEQKKLWLETQFKVSYIIDIENKNANFYFIVPDVFKTIILEKLAEIWSKCTVEEVEPIKEFSTKATRYQMFYKKDDAFSLDVNKSSNEPLNSILNVVDIMQENDRVLIGYNFHPTSQFGWKERYDKAITEYKEGKPVEKDRLSFNYIAKMTLHVFVEIIDIVVSTIDDLLSSKIKKKGNEYVGLAEALATALDTNRELSSQTKRKKDQIVLDTEIALISESTDKTREYNNINAVATAYRSLDGDNELIYKLIPAKNKFNITDKSWGLKTSQLSTDECQNFIQIPGKELMNQIGIKHINIEEMPVPDELRNGYISLGDCTYKGDKCKAYLSDDKEVRRLGLALLSRQGGGKTTYLCNYANNVAKKKENLVHIDFIKNCEASKTIENSIKDKDNVIIMDFSTEEGLQSLAYNEVRFTENMDWFEKQAIANMKTEQTLTLMNAVNTNGEPLTNKMERYFCAVCDIVYLVNDNATLKDIIRCLQDHVYRDEILQAIPEEIKGDLSEEILAVQSLDEWSKGTKNNEPEKVGTKESKIEGILDRVNLLRRDFYLKKMVNKSPKNNVNFVEALNSGKMILVRMPQYKFKDYVKNVITTFIITKCWLACELRGEQEFPLLTHIAIDEISQTKTAEKYMESKLTQTRKFGVKFVICGQYLNQLDRDTIYSLKGAGFSFMLLRGAIKEDFNYLKDEMNGSFEYEDLKSLPPYHSLNIIETTEGKSCFVTKLPPKQK